jgi:hypothetical protein
MASDTERDANAVMEERIAAWLAEKHPRVEARLTKLRERDQLTKRLHGRVGIHAMTYK